MSALICPLCQCRQTHQYHQDNRRQYYQCCSCELVFVDPAQRLTALQERAIYDRHQNNPQDEAYRRFLSRLFQPLLATLSPGARGLDFGCGPGPTLSLMFEEAGFPVALYDVFYQADKAVLAEHYHFITATEVVEHLYQPGEVIRLLWQQLHEGGTLALMTKLVRDQQAFVNWHYKNDQTHVCFFSRASFHWLAAQLNAGLRFIGNDVIFLTKPAAGIV